jgi:hypothetical protein
MMFSSWSMAWPANDTQVGHRFSLGAWTAAWRGATVNRADAVAATTQSTTATTKNLFIVDTTAGVNASSRKSTLLKPMQKKQSATICLFVNAQP